MVAERLQKIIAKAGVCSRRKAEELIVNGLVAVDGVVIRELGQRYDPSAHLITVEGKPLAAPEQKQYLLLNKPKGYVTTLHDPQGRPTVVSLLQGIEARVFPVGRLDQDTEGALLLTNDGEFAQRILHPRYEIKRTYLATVAGHPKREKLEQLEKGILLAGRKTWPAALEVVAREKQSTRIEIVIHEGRKRQVRRMFEAIGHRVLELKRIAYGGLKLGTIPSGSYKKLSADDLKRIFS
jgi:23S rRNA pseudouridine2605 synthase